MSLVRFRPKAPQESRNNGFLTCGCSSSGRAPPCQGGGSEFEPRHPLHFLIGLLLRLERNNREAVEILLRRISVFRVRAAASADALSGRASSSAPFFNRALLRLERNNREAVEILLRRISIVCNKTRRHSQVVRHGSAKP